MSIFNKNTNYSRISNYLIKKLNSKSSIIDKIQEQQWIVTQISELSFEFYHTTFEVEFYFHFENHNTDELIIINDHRYSKFQKKGNATLCLNEIENIFQIVCKELKYVKLIIIFEIKKIEDETSQSVRTFLTKLTYEKTQNINPEKWVKIFNLK